MYRKTILPNGLRIITHDMPNMESVALGIWINVGSRYENRKDKGIAHFLEHLLFKGTKKYSCNKIKHSIEGVGGALNGFTSEELSCYLAKFPQRHLNSALDILSEMVLNPLLQAKEIEKERGVIIEEIKMYKDLPQHYVYQLLDGLLWPSHPLGVNIAGTIKSVSSINRNSLISFKRRLYTCPNIIISACGRLKHDLLVNKVETIFGKLRNEKRNNFSRVTKRQTGPKLNIVAKDTEQTHLALGFYGLRREHPARYALGLLHVILGGNMSSRLFSEVRERQGLAYEIATHVKSFADVGAFIINAGIDNRKVKKSLNVILNELKRIKSKSINKKELGRAKDFYIGQLALSLEDTLSHMLWIGESTATLNKTYALEEIKEQISKVGENDIRVLSQKIFKPQNLNLALIGPIKKQEKELQSLLKRS